MELYTKVAFENSKNLTLNYSTSFGISSKLFDKSIRDDIYAIYAMVRIADEIVDTYKGPDAMQILNAFENEVYRALQSGYSADLTVHAFAQTARAYQISPDLIEPFFSSMRMDLAPHTYDPKLYAEYIHGSAEVVGLMCLKVFVNDEATYTELAPGASMLGSAYQKVNFLRDLATDYTELGRLYFPDRNYDTFDESDKKQIITEIQQEFSAALPALLKLPHSCKKATLTSYVYYRELLKRLEQTPASIIKQQRVSVPTSRKLYLLLKTVLLPGAIRG